MTHALTAVIPCKNEEDNIEACVEAIQGIAQEILVADSGSTDRTVSLAQRAGCRIIHREYVHSGDFKNWAIPQATHAWVLLVDADERVTAELAKEVRGLLEKGPACDGYWIRRRNYFLGREIRHGVWRNDKVLRLFRRDVACYVGDNDHAEVEISTGKVGQLRAQLRHNTYNSYEQVLRKVDRYTGYQAEVWKAQGRKPRLYQLMLRPPLRFFMSYVVRGGFLDGAAGLQVAMLVAFYSFLKQARLWELSCADQPPRSLDSTASAQHQLSQTERSAA